MSFKLPDTGLQANYIDYLRRTCLENIIHICGATDTLV